jgi:hypothetical protein
MSVIESEGGGIDRQRDIFGSEEGSILKELTYFFKKCWYQQTIHFSAVTHGFKTIIPW